MELEYACPLKGRRLERIQLFLQGVGINLDESVEVTVSLIEGQEVLATGSRQGNVLKCIGVAEKSRGEGLTAAIVTELVKDALQNGYNHLFIYTKPENCPQFQGLGFYLITATVDVALLENRKDGIRQFIQSLTQTDISGTVGAIVANCNPFTNGHLYLVETAAKMCDFLYFFILSEDCNQIPAGVRFQLAKDATKHIPNIAVHPTGNYLISFVTFPDYFFKEKESAKAANAELDLNIFAKCFAEPLGITRRFVGSEPYCPVTSSYNRQMQEYLPDYGIEVVEIQRREQNGIAISASRVRELLRQGRLSEIRPLVPNSTYQYLERMTANEAFT